MAWLLCCRLGGPSRLRVCSLFDDVAEQLFGQSEAGLNADWQRDAVADLAPSYLALALLFDDVGKAVTDIAQCRKHRVVDALRDILLDCLVDFRRLCLGDDAVPNLCPFAHYHRSFLFKYISVKA